MQWKMEETLQGNCACIQPPFSAARIARAGKQSAPFERAENPGLETTWVFSNYFVWE